MPKTAKKKTALKKKITLTDVTHAIDKMICENDLFTDEDIAAGFTMAENKRKSKVFSKKRQISVQFPNCSILIIRPKQPFVDWINSNKIYDYEITVQMGRLLLSCILIPKFNDNFKIFEYCDKNFDDIWIWALSNYSTDVKLYPKQRTLGKFKEWFELELCSEVADFSVNR